MFQVSGTYLQTIFAAVNLCELFALGLQGYLFVGIILELAGLGLQDGSETMSWLQLLVFFGRFLQFWLAY